MPTTVLNADESSSPRSGLHAALPRELTIYTIGEAHARLLDSLATAGVGAWRIDAAAVDEVDGAGLQLLLSLRASAAAVAADFDLSAPSAVLLDACRALGLTTLLPACADAEHAT